MSDLDPETPPPDESETASSMRRAVLIGLGIGIGTGLLAFFLIAIPFYTLASFEPNGMDRPIIRTGLFRIALPVGAVVGIVVGSISGRWVHRGGKWPTSESGDRYSAR